MDGARVEGGQGVTGRYEVRDYRGGLKVIVWWEPGKPELVMTTIAPERIEALAAALAEYLAGGPADAG